MKDTIILDVQPHIGYLGVRNYYLIFGLVMAVILIVDLALANFDRFEAEFFHSSIPLLIFALASVFFYRKESKFIPKIEISPEVILLKTSWIRSAKRINWQELERIQLGSYRIAFHYKTKETEVFEYSHNAATSKAIKSALRDKGAMNNVPVAY